jgi:hypothetical protein
MLGIVGSNTLDELAIELRERYPTIESTDINSHGFRDKEILTDCDTCFYGCSVTYGYGVDINERYTSLIDVPSNNFSLCGIGIDEMLLLFMATSKFVTMKRAVFMFPSINRYTVNLEDRYYNIFPNYHKTNPGHKLIKEFGDVFYQLPESYFIDKFKNQLATIIYISQLKNIELCFSSWVPKVYDMLPDNVTKIGPMINDKLASDNLHPSRLAHKDIASKLNGLYRN